MDILKTIDLLRKTNSETSYDMNVVVEIVEAWEKVKNDEPKQAACEEDTAEEKVQPDLVSMNYYMFDNHDKWAIIAACTEYGATHIYCDSLNMPWSHVEKEGAPTQISPDRAFAIHKEALGRVQPGYTENDVARNFNKHQNAVLLNDHWKHMRTFAKEL